MHRYHSEEAPRVAPKGVQKKVEPAWYVKMMAEEDKGLNKYHHKAKAPHPRQTHG